MLILDVHYVPTEEGKYLENRVVLTGQMPPWEQMRMYVINPMKNISKVIQPY